MNWWKRYQDRRFWKRHREIMAKAAEVRFQRQSEASRKGWQTRRRHKAEEALRQAEVEGVSEDERRSLEHIAIYGDR